MKVDPKNAVAQVAASKAQPFKKLLSDAKADMKREAPTVPNGAALKSPGLTTKPRPVGPVLKATTAQTAQATKTVGQVLQQARVHADGEAHRLGDVRSAHTQTAHSLQQVRTELTETALERGDAKLLEVITRELTADLTPANHAAPLDVLPQQPIAATQGQPQPKVDAPPEARAAQAVALIEKIERFVKSQRPGLALTLNNSLGARVEIERIGPKEIALKLVGMNGPPTAEAVSRIREELRARGLKVGALSVG